MSLTSRGVMLMIATACFALAAGFLLTQAPITLALITPLGLLWAYGHQQHWRWVTPLAFIALTVSAAAGTFWGVAPIWLLVAVAAALAAWDLDHFTHRLSSVEESTYTRALARQHFTRLAIAAAAGLGLGIIALNVQVELSFRWAIGLALALFIGLGQVVRRLRRETD